MSSLRQGSVVLGCVFIGFAASAGPGIVASAAEPERWVASAIGAGAGDAQRRVAELEQRLKELEAERGGADPSRSAPQPASGELGSLLAQRQEVMAQNQELIARNHALSVENRTLTQSHLFEPSAAAPVACAPAPDGADPKAQLRYWAERLRNGDSGFRGGLTPEQNAALNVLLRRERSLDPHNPWQER